MTLNFKDVQLYIKRLRKRQNRHSPNWKISYYLCGEYGTQRMRPHYHLIVFNARPDDLVKAWRDPGTTTPIGEVYIGHDCSGAAIAYTLKYINKQTKIPQHAKDDRTPERALMSKGLGSNYLTPSTVLYHRDNLERAYSLLPGGIKVPLSRYFKDKIFPTTTTSYNLIVQHPSLLLHFEENKILRKNQEAAIAKLQSDRLSQDGRTDREKHESIRNSIEAFKLFNKNKRE